MIEHFLLFFGALFLFFGALGGVRLPDTLCRSHPLTKAMTLGVCSMLLALTWRLEDAWGMWKVILIISLQFMTIPISSHLVAFIAYRSKFHQKSLSSWKSKKRNVNN